MPPGRVKVLQVASSDITVARLLLPLMNRLQDSGYSVAAACADGRFARDMAGKGYVIHTLPMSRSLSPRRNLRAFWSLYRLLRRQRYDVVHVHTPVAAVVGRLAAWMAGVPVVIYTAHGFYFHDEMKPWAMKLAVCAERFAGKFNDLLFTQSAEDAQAAVRHRIAPSNRVVWISNGVDVRRFAPVSDNSAVRARFGLGKNDRVVGFVGRLIREKGVIELLDAMSEAAWAVPDLTLLIAGDNKTAGDRDQETQLLVQRRLESGDLPYRVVFTGFIDAVEEMMQAIDVFALPSHREGMPRTVIEAMASGKPVIATNIRGCREEVVHGETGYLVPLQDVQALSKAIVRVLSSPQLAAGMGAKGRERAELYFDETMVLERQVEHYSRLIRERLPALASTIVEPGPAHSATAVCHGLADSGGPPVSKS